MLYLSFTCTCSDYATNRLFSYVIIKYIYFVSLPVLHIIPNIKKYENSYFSYFINYIQVVYIFQTLKNEQLKLR